MTRYGEDFELDQKMMDDIALYMNDGIREYLHNELAPCTPEKFLRAYVERDAKFAEFLKSEFDIELD